MTEITVCTWLWGSKYGPHYVERLARGVARHLEQPHRFVVFRPQPEDEYLTQVPGCLARLRMFDPAWQKANGIEEGQRVVCLDLDLIITGELDPLFDRPETFVILQGANAVNPCPYNGSVFMLRGGAHPQVWSDFSLAVIGMLPFYAFPDDQGWLAHKLPNSAAWRAGASSGIYAFQKPGWPAGQGLPNNARIVAFPGSRDPSQFEGLDWVREHWCR